MNGPDHSLRKHNIIIILMASQLSMDRADSIRSLSLDAAQGTFQEEVCPFLLRELMKEGKRERMGA